jgi:hypothetical protein
MYRLPIGSQMSKRKSLLNVTLNLEAKRKTSDTIACLHVKQSIKLRSKFLKYEKEKEINN